MSRYLIGSSELVLSAESGYIDYQATVEDWFDSVLDRSPMAEGRRSYLLGISLMNGNKFFIIHKERLLPPPRN